MTQKVGRSKKRLNMNVLNLDFLSNIWQELNQDQIWTNHNLNEITWPIRFEQGYFYLSKSAQTEMEMQMQQALHTDYNHYPHKAKIHALLCVEMSSSWLSEPSVNFSSCSKLKSVVRKRNEKLGTLSYLCLSLF